MKPVAFDYQQPATLAAACTALASVSGIVKVLGGSQSLGPMLNLRLARPGSVVDVSRLSELRGVTAADGRVRIGAAVTHAEIEDGVHDALRGTLLQAVARGIAYRAVRNRGTLGGSLAHADPAADWVVVCTALAARLELASAHGRRTVAMDDFMLGAYTTALQDGEVIVAVSVPREGPGTRWAYEKACRKTGEFAEASCAAWFDPSQRVGRIVLGALDGAPRVLTALTLELARAGSAAVEDKGFDERVAAAVAEAAPERDEVDRMQMRAVVRRCLQQLVGEPAR
jgi:carbon-monoxide dehydrogenase medium subunit